MNNKKHWIIFDYDNNLKKKDVYKCESKIIFNNSSNMIIHKYINKDNIKIDIYVTYLKSSEWNMNLFVRGFLYKDQKEYEISSMTMFSSLQIEDMGYDKIALCKIPNNIFDTL